MTRQNRKRIAFPGLVLCLVGLGFSDTACAQTVTLSGPDVSNNVLTFPTITGGSGISAPQTVHVVTSSDPSTVIVQISNQAPWIQIDHVGSVNTSASGVDLHVTINTTGLSQGSHQGTFSVSTTGSPASQQVMTVNVQISGTSLLSANPATLSFSAQVGTLAANIPTQTVAITSSGQQLSFTIATNPNNVQPWLVAVNTTGTTGGSPITVGVNPANLSTGVYTGTLVAQSTTTSDSVVVTVTLTLNPPSNLSVTPTTLLPFLYQLGSNPPSTELMRTLTVSSSTASVPFNVTMSPSVGWLIISPTTSATGTSGQGVLVTLSVNPTGLAPGQYTTQVTVSISGGASLNSILVQLVVSSNPLLSLNQNALSFTTQFAGGSPPQGQPVQVTTLNGGNSVSFTYSSDSAWLTATTTGFNTPATLTVNVNPSALAVGVYTGTITVTPNNSDANLYSLAITVTLTVGNSSQVMAAPPLLVFSYQIGQAMPQAETVQILSQGQPVSFNISASGATASNCPASWLAASSNGSALAMTPSTVTVTVTAMGMTPGTCTGTVTISYPAQSLTPTNIYLPVTVNVATTPLLNISIPSGFGVLTVPAGGNAASPQGIALTSTSPSAQVNFSVSATSNGPPPPWLSIGQNGSLTPQTVTPQIAAGSLPVGAYAGSIMIASNNLPSGPLTIPITLTVTPSITVAAAPQTLTFNQAQGGPLPISQNVTLTSSATGANFQVSIPSTATCSWLQVTPTSGAASGALTFAVQQNTLPQNTYACQVTLSFLNSATASAVVTATLVVGPPQTITAAPTSLAFTYQLTLAAPASQAVALSSNGGPVNFAAAASSTGNWLVIDTTSGATPKSINVSVNPQNIPAGTAANAVLNGTVTITAPGVLTTPLTIAVALTIVGAPVPVPVTIMNSATAGFGAIAPGEIIAIKGTGLGPVTPANFTVSGGVVSSTLGGVQVLFDGIPGTPIYVSATQINAVVPYEIAGRTSTNVTIAYNGVPSAPIPQQVGPVAPGIFTLSATGSGQASVGNQNYSINGPTGGVVVVAPRSHYPRDARLGGRRVHDRRRSNRPAEHHRLGEFPGAVAAAGGLDGYIGDGNRDRRRRTRNGDLRGRRAGRSDGSDSGERPNSQRRQRNRRPGYNLDRRS